MEDLSKREQEIIAILYRAGDFVSAEEIAASLCVSTKTIYRALQSIENKLGSSFGIKKYPGKGYRLDKSDIRTENYKDTVQASPFMGMSVEERRHHQMVLLLLQSPRKVSINKLAAYYYISTASIVNDLKYIKETAGKHNLQLVSAHDGTCIEGQETDVRKLLMGLLGYSQDILRENLHINKETYHVLFQEFSEPDIRFVETVLHELEASLGEEIRDPYYINIFTHLLILIKRINRSQTEETSENKTVMLKYESTMALEAMKKIVSRLEDYLKVCMPQKEKEYIYQYIVSSRIEDSAAIQLFDDQVTPSREADFVELLIRKVSDAMHIPFEQDEGLKTSLYLHIHPLAKRIRYKLSVCNPLLADIRKEFASVFDVVAAAIREQVIFPEFTTISDDEIAYVAVYFQAAFEKYVEKKKVLLVCSSGVGTSHLLSVRVKRAFPNWEVVDIVSAGKVHEAVERCRPDLILTTVHIEVQTVPTVLVSAVLSKFDILKLKNIFSINEEP
jgi:activator of the mannose operon, transcriptional antiterminator